MQISRERTAVPQPTSTEQQKAVGLAHLPQLRIFFVLTIASFVITALVGGAASWDGSYFLFSALDTGQPFAPHDRWINSVAQVPTLLLSRVISDTGILMVVFGLSYAAFPIAALICSWLIVRQSNPTLFVWIAFGTTFGLVVGQFSLTTEALLAIHLTWPLAAAAVVPFRRWHAPVVAVFSILLFISHPTAIPLFGMLAVMALLIAWRVPGHRVSKLIMAASYGAVAALALVRFLVSRTQYEADQLEVTRLEQAYAASLAGMAMLALTLVLVAAFALFMAPRFRRQRPVRLALYSLELVCIVGATTLLILRASLPQLWTGTLDLRTWAIVLSLPFFAALLGERLLDANQSAEDAITTWAHRANSLMLTGISFFLIMATQGAVWSQLTNTLRAELARNTYGCISMTSLPWMERTPLNHWSITTYSLLLQGREPQRVVQGWETCTTTDYTRGVTIAPWEAPRPESTGWFNLETLEQRAIADTQPIGLCQVSFAEGWFWAEARGSSQWRWMGSEATLRIASTRAQQVVVSGNVLAAGRDNTLRLGRDAPVTVAASARRATAFEQTLQLQPGNNDVRLSSLLPPVPLASDDRPLTLGIENLRITNTAEQQACSLRP